MAARIVNEGGIMMNMIRVASYHTLARFMTPLLSWFADAIIMQESTNEQAKFRHHGSEALHQGSPRMPSK